jgi:hypothetical protein
MPFPMAKENEKNPMKLIATVALFLFISVHSLAQKGKEVTMGPDQEPSKDFPINDRYRFPDFHNGFVITHEGKRSQPLKLNFNLFSGLPQLIDENGDTLFLDEQVAKYIQIKTTTYQHNSSKGYHELILNTEPVKLGIQRVWKIDRIETMYLDPTTGHQTKSLTRDAGNTTYSPRLHRQVRNETRIYARDSSYYFIDVKGRDYKANKSNLLRLFSDHKEKIDEHLKQEPIDFKNEEDLKKVLQFCLALGGK